MAADHYSTLGVSRDAPPDEIKRAYRKASSAAHPDREGGSTERQQAVNAAYACLSDPARRAHYDQHGADTPLQSEPLARYKDLAVKAFREACGNEKCVNPLLDAGALIQGGIARGKEVRAATCKSLRRAEVRLKNLITQESLDSEDFLRGWLEGQVASHRRMLEQIDEMEADLLKALEFLNNWEQVDDEELVREAQSRSGVTYGMADIQAALNSANRFGGFSRF